MSQARISCLSQVNRAFHRDKGTSQKLTASSQLGICTLPRVNPSSQLGTTTSFFACLLVAGKVTIRAVSEQRLAQEIGVCFLHIFFVAKVSSEPDKDKTLKVCKEAILLCTLSNNILYVFTKYIAFSFLVMIDEISLFCCVKRTCLFLVDATKI